MYRIFKALLICTSTAILFISCGTNDNSTNNNKNGTNQQNTNNQNNITENNNNQKNNNTNQDDNYNIVNNSTTNNNTETNHTTNDANSTNECPDFVDEHPDCPGYWLEKVTGKIVDKDGQPIAEAMAFVCMEGVEGISQGMCAPPERTDANGEFEVNITGVIRCNNGAAIRYMKDPQTIILGCPIDLNCVDGHLNIEKPGILISMPEPTLPAKGDETEVHTVTTSDGVTLDIIPSEMSYSSLGYDGIRILTWDFNAWGNTCFVDSNNPPDGLFALMPEVEIETTNGAHITMPNSKNLPAGTIVDIFGLGGLDTKTHEGEHILEGEWVIVGKGTVSEDGSTVKTLQDNGLPFLTWVGYRVQ